MISKALIITNPSGLHLRPVGRLCETLGNYKCKITMGFNGTESNAKSVLSVLSACVKQGDEVTFTCDGKDEEEALAAIIRLVETGELEAADKN